MYGSLSFSLLASVYKPASFKAFCLFFSISTFLFLSSSSCFYRSYIADLLFWSSYIIILIFASSSSALFLSSTVMYSTLTEWEWEWVCFPVALPNSSFNLSIYSKSSLLYPPFDSTFFFVFVVIIEALWANLKVLNVS